VQYIVWLELSCSRRAYRLCCSASSTGLLLRTTGLKVTAIKIDPYMNIDAGTMRPTEHGVWWFCFASVEDYIPMFNLGEVYVLNDGGEVDLDLGNYERYLNITLSRDNNITTGKIYREVIEKEVGHFFAIVSRPSLNLLFLVREKGNIWGKQCR
jgi:hypothetical protein